MCDHVVKQVGDVALELSRLEPKRRRLIPHRSLSGLRDQTLDSDLSLVLLVGAHFAEQTMEIREVFVAGIDNVFLICQRDF